LEIHVNGTDLGAVDLITVGEFQLNEGPVAAPFERAGGTIGGELPLCQRYYEKTFAAGTAPANGSAGAFLTSDGLTTLVASNLINMVVKFKVSKVKTPSIVKYGNSSGYWLSSTYTAVNGPSGVITTEGFNVLQQETPGLAILIGHWTADAEI